MAAHNRTPLPALQGPVLASVTDLANAMCAANGGKLPRTEKEVKALLHHPQVSVVTKTTLDRFDMPDPEHGFKHPEYPHTSAATPPGCMTRCVVCAGQWFAPSQSFFLPYVQSLTDEEATKRIAGLKTATATNLDYTRTFIDNTGNSIVTWWENRSLNQRKEILRQAMPDMAPRKGFPFGELFRQETKRDWNLLRALAVKYRKSLLLPWLDIETLSQEASHLLGLLYQRTRSKPAEWAAIDSSYLNFTFTVPYLQSSYNPHCVQMHGGQYGKLVSWEKDAAHRLDMIGFPRALLVFEAQHELSSLLRKVVDNIVAPPVPSAVQRRDKFDQLVSNGFMKGKDWAGIHDLFYSSPPKVDMKGIVDVLLTRQNAAEDELWLMQTDPAYLRARFARFEGAMVFEDRNAEKTKYFRAKIAVLPLAVWESFDRLRVEAMAALRTLEALDAPIKAGKPLPEQAEVALAGFERALLEEFKEQSAHIMTIILCSKTFRQYYSGTQDGLTVINTLGKAVNEKDPLFYHLGEMSRYNERLKYPAAYHLGMIEQIIGSSKAQASRVDQLLLSALSGLVAINEVLNAARLHRPRYQSFEQLSNSPHARACDERRDWLALSKVAQAMDHYLLYDALEDFLGLPPLPRAINKNTLQVFDKSHEAMQRFWQAVYWRWAHGLWGLELERLCGARGRATTRNSAVISFSITKTYLEGVATERKTLVNTIDAQETKAAAAQAEAVPKPDRVHTLPQEVWGQETAETFRPPAERSKPKTRPSHPARIASDQDDIEVTETAEAVKELAVSRIDVNKASYDIFQKMYGTRSEDQSDISWEDFIKAMIDAKFSVTPSGGSVFTFKSVRDGGSINFHRPHPDPSIDPIMLRIMGRRLNKWFKFDKDTFTVRQKVKASKEQEPGQV